MITIHKFRHLEFRRKVTDCILEMLARLTEADRNIFVWYQYHGYQVELIAEMLGRRSAEVETTLSAIQSILHQKIRNLLAQDPQVDPEAELHDRVAFQELGAGNAGWITRSQRGIAGRSIQQQLALKRICF